MDIKLERVEYEDKEILRNLLEKYNYEFSQYDTSDVDKLGMYGYMYLDYYWTEAERRTAYFIKVDDMLAGFVMVNDYSEAYDRETDYAVAEFFVMYKYRRNNVGKNTFFMLMDMYKGKNWQLKMHPHNTVSVLFWEKVVSEYTGGKYELVRDYPESEYDDGTRGDIFFYES